MSPRAVLRFVVQLWPLAVVWLAWKLADGVWAEYLRSFPLGSASTPLYRAAHWVWSTAALLLGPGLVMATAIALYRNRIGDRVMPVAGVVSMVAISILTGGPEYQRLWPYVGIPNVPFLAVLRVFDHQLGVAIIVGIVASLVGLCFAGPLRPLSGPGSPPVRANSDNHGHADWLSMTSAQELFPGPDPAYGGLAVGEAYRVDQDAAAKRRAFNPADPETWGKGGQAPLLIDPCRFASTHALVFAGAGGFKTTSVAVPTMLTWTGAAVVLDPSLEIGPMMQRFREQNLGHQVVTLDPKNAAAGNFNVLDWIDITSPLAETHTDAVIVWICSETRGANASGSEFFRQGGRNLITCLLDDMLWDPSLEAANKTLRTLRRRIVTPEDAMRELLETISLASHSPRARDLAATLKGAVKETYSGIYQNAVAETAWLSTTAFADLVSGSSFQTKDLTGGKLTVFIQIPLAVLNSTPALARVVVGALLNALYQADGRVEGRVLFLLDEVARLGYMKVLELARDAGRKYGITVMLLYQSLGQLIEQWGLEGKRAWYESSSWRLFAAVQDLETAREISALCGEYTIVTASTGDTQGSQSQGSKAESRSTGRSENRSETKRALIKPEELLQDTRTDEAFVLSRGNPPLRCGRAVYFRRSEWKDQVDDNRFHRPNAG
jgi:type IV secretion system protein VirD4